jgi:hypothetical protein
VIIPRLPLIGVVLAAAIATAGNATAQSAPNDPHCIYPDPHTLVARDIAPEIVEYRLFDTPHGTMRWLFLSWEGYPADGMAFVLACDGHVVAKREIGYVVAHSWGSPGSAGPGTGVDVTTSEMVDRSTPAPHLVETWTWLQFDGKAIDVLWTHARTVMPAVARGDTTRYLYSWSLDRNGLHVKGKRAKFSPADDGVVGVALPEEHYCFHADIDRYVRCW